MIFLSGWYAVNPTNYVASLSIICVNDFIEFVNLASEQLKTAFTVTFYFYQDLAKHYFEPITFFQAFSDWFKLELI